jgi:hypothetical protein
MRTIRNKPNRSVKSIENAALLPGATYAPDLIPCLETPYAVRPSMREAWLARVATTLDECDLIFVDPDNGIGPLSLNLTHKRAGKSVMIEELLLLSRRSNGKQRAIVVYHHQSRQGGHLEQMQTRKTHARHRPERVRSASRESLDVTLLLHSQRRLRNNRTSRRHCKEMA